MPFERQADGRFVITLGRSGPTFLRAEDGVLRENFIDKTSGLKKANDLAETLHRCNIALPQEARVMDLCCGYGWLLRGMAATPNFTHVASLVGIDINSELIGMWEELERLYGQDPRLQFQLGDANSLEDIADNSIDMVLWTHAGDQFPAYAWRSFATLDPWQLARAISRVLKSGGVFYGDDPDFSFKDNKEFTEALEATGLHLLPAAYNPKFSERLFQQATQVETE